MQIYSQTLEDFMKEAKYRKKIILIMHCLVFIHFSEFDILVYFCPHKCSIYSPNSQKVFKAVSNVN